MSNPEYGVYSGQFFGLLAVFVLLSTLALIVRSVRARGVERLQIKWFLFAVVFIVLVVPFQESVVAWLSIPE